MNKSYLKYLFSSRKFALLFVAVMYLMLCGVPFLEGADGMNAQLYSSSLAIGMILNVIMVYVLPVLLFSFAHKRRSSDQMMALPMSRKQLLITPLLFGFLLTGGCWVVTSLLLYFIFATGFVNFTLVLSIIGYGLLIILGMLIINTALFLTANNVFDGIVMIAAYTAIPLLVEVGWLVFNATMVAGGDYATISFSGYFSPVYMSMCNIIQMMDALSTANALQELNITYFLVPLVYVIVACVALVPLFLRRKSERADQLSDGKAAYPVIITVYLFVLLTMVSFWTVETQSIAATIPYYLLLLLAYVIAQFVYRRSISFHLNIFIRYAICLAAGLGVAFIGWQTSGFGIARNYNYGEPGSNLAYSYYTLAEEGDLSMPKAFIYDTDTYVEVRFDVKMPVDNLNEDVMKILEKKRNEAIDDFYARTLPDYPANLYINNERYIIEDGSGFYMNDNYYNYSCRPFTVEELQEIDQYTTVYVGFSDAYGNWTDYTLDEYLNKYGG